MLLSIATDIQGLPWGARLRKPANSSHLQESAMIVLMTGGAVLALLMREDRAPSEHLAPAQVGEARQQRDDAQAEPQPQRRIGPPRLARQHVHRHLPREVDPLFR